MALNPHQRNKVDISKMTEEEQKLFRLYGKLPTHKSVLNKSLKERKYFDSGDYALSKAGKSSPQSVGTAIPSPDMIPHVKSPDSSVVGSSPPPASSGPHSGTQPLAAPIPVSLSGGVNSTGPTPGAAPLSSSPTSGLSHELKNDEVMKDGEEDIVENGQPVAMVG